MPKIQILTSQKVSIEYETAPWLERASAFAIDFVVIVICLSFLYNLNYLDNGNTADILYYAVFGFVLSTFTLWNEYFFNGVTLGKKIVKIRVMRLDGEPPSFGDYFGRWIFRIADIYFSAGMLATFLVTSTARSQRTGDMIANTVVVKDRVSMDLSLEDLLKLATTENYKPVYENVTRLTEDEMLVIKEAVDRYNMYSNAAHREALTLLLKRVMPILEIKKVDTDPETFLRTLIKDYIVLTR